MNEFKNCPLVYITWLGGNFNSFSPNFRRLLEILEVDIDKCRKIDQPTQFDKIILPDSSFGAIATNECRETIDRVRNFALKNRMPTSNKKVYYFHGRIQVGEERLAEYFKSKGYEIISPQKLTLDEQLNWLINCESFASTLGSCSHNSVFLRDRTETIIIPREGIFGRDYQLPLDQINLVNATYIDSTMSIFDKGNRYHCYIISEQLKKFFGDKWNGYEEEDFKIFLQYVKTSLTKGFDVDSGEKNYYDFSPIQEFLAQLRKYEDLMVAYGMPHRWEYFRSLVSYQTHVDTKAWSSWNSEEQISNPLNQKFDIQAVKINFPGHKVYYSVYYNDKEGWSAEVLSPEMAGTTGKAKSIYGIRIRLDEIGAKGFDILYRVHTFDDTWTPWAKNGEAIYSFGVKLNALQIKLEPKT